MPTFDLLATPVPAQELTEQDAQDLNSNIYRKVRQAEMSFYELGDMLYVAWYGSIWKVLGLDSWEQWLAGVRLSKGASSDMIRTKELRLAFPDYEARILDTNPSNLRLILPHLQQDRETRVWHITEEDLDALLDKANTHGWRQLREHLNNDIDPLEIPASIPAHDNPGSETTPREVLITCHYCGKKDLYEVTP